jgi:hypothetical protein
LTTDLKLISYGVQAVDNMFLKWFVKNPSCEFVHVYNDRLVGYEYDNYSIIFPLEYEQETSEEASENFARDRVNALKDKKEWNPDCVYHEAFNGYVVGSTETAKRMYSEEDLREAFKQSRQCKIFEKDMPPVYNEFEDWFNEFKKK